MRSPTTRPAPFAVISALLCLGLAALCGAEVKSLNGSTGDLTLTGASGVTVTLSGSSLVISGGSGGSGGGSCSLSGPASGDLAGAYPNPFVAWVAGQAPASVAGAVSGVSAATSANIPGGMVKRDAADSFSAAGITAGSLAGDGAGLIGVTVANVTHLGGLPADSYQPRLTRSCPRGTAIAAIDADGGVVCATVRLPLYSSAKSVRSVLDAMLTGGIGTALAIGADGWPIVSYSGANGDGSYNLSAVHCTAVDCRTHGAPVVLDEGPNYGDFSAIAIGSDGLPIVTYARYGGRWLRLVHCNVADCSAHGAPIVLDSEASLIAWSSIAIGTDGLPVISYAGQGTNPGRGTISVVHCTAADCGSHGAPVEVYSSTAFQGLPNSLTIGADGWPVIAYAGVSVNNATAPTLNLSAVHCSSLDCSSHGTPVVLDSVPGSAFYPHAVIGADGLPIIGYGGVGVLNNELTQEIVCLAPQPVGGTGAACTMKPNPTVIHCTVVDCSSHGDPIVLDAVSKAGYWISMAIGSDGFPIVSYLGVNGAGNYNLTLVRCTAADCSAGGNPMVPDSTFSFGFYTALAIGIDGLPVISHEGVIGGRLGLSVEHCANYRCAPPFVRR